jgi:AcrR family transcriptional regulator
VFRVIRRDGVDQASLRAVATEAGLVIGSVRHYFATHDEMIVFAMRVLADRVTTRIAALGKPQANALTPVSSAETVHRRSACAGSIA